MSKIPPQLTLRQRKTLCGRTILIDTLTRHIGQFADEPSGIELSAIELVLLGLANQPVMNGTATNAPSPHNNQFRLDSFLKSISDHIDHSKPHVSHAHRELLLPILETAQEKLVSICCESCSSHICNGSANDDAAVVQPGSCVRVYRELFDACLDEANSLYGKACPELTSNQMPEVLLSTKYFLKPHDLDTCKAVGGVTEYECRGTRRSTVTLRICVEDLNLESRNAVAYVFLCTN